MNFKIKPFNELTTTELYDILKVRAEIFVVEKKMNCQDLDGLDFICKHMYIEEDNNIIAYLRAFNKSEGVVKLSRVLTLKHGNGLGRKLMESCLTEIKKDLKCKKVILNAQKDAVGYYKKMGFNIVSEEFIEEGIPHFAMEMNI